MALPQRSPISGEGGSHAHDVALRLDTGGRARDDHAWQHECSEAARVETRYAEVRRGIERILDADRHRGGHTAPEALATLVDTYVRGAVATDTTAVANAVVARAVLCAILEYERWPVAGPERTSALSLTGRTA